MFIWLGCQDMTARFRLLLWLLSFCVAQDLAAQDVPAACKDYLQKDESSAPPVDAPPRIQHGSGLLWKITAKDGSTSHLFGTIHSQDRRATSLPPQVRLALVQSQQLVMEVVPDRDSSRVFSSSILHTDGTRLESLLDQEIFHDLARLSPAYGIDPEQVPHLKPWAAFTLIGRPRPVRAASQDEVLMQFALARGKPVHGLETMDELVATLEGLSLADQIEILNDTVCNHAHIIRDARTLLDLYVARDLSGMVNFNAQPHHDEAVFDRYLQRLVYDRNQRMVERMTEYLRAGGAVFTVGAMHLPGEKGLLRSLEKSGYAVTRVY